MRNILLLIAAATVAVASAIMPYKPMLKEGREWLVGTGVPGFTLRDSCHVKCISDTVVDGKIIHRWYGNSREEHDKDAGFIIYWELYEKDGAVYAFSTKYHKSSKLIDFNMAVGDTCHWNGLVGDGMVVVTGDSISVRGNTYRRLKLKKPYESIGMTWVEGIGFDKFEPFESVNAPFSQFKWVMSVWDDGECVFTEDDFNAPAITAGVITAEAERPADNRIYDLMGREIHDPQPGTVYIRNGKKYVMSTK